MPEVEKYRVEGARLWVRWVGLLDRDAVVREGAVLARSLTPSIKQVLVDTMSVTACPEAAKAELVELQKVMCQGGRRTVWLDERAVFRGMALWVMHLASDPVGKAVATMPQAEAWLSSSEQRESVAAKRTVMR